MSVVVGKRFEDRIEIGADAQVTVYGERRLHLDKDDGFACSKIVSVDIGWVFGTVGLLREASFMAEYCTTNRPGTASLSGLNSFYQGYIGFAGSQINSPYKTFNDFLMVYGDSLWLMCDFNVKEVLTYEALGTGRQYAMGVLYSQTEEDDIIKPLEAAASLDLYCHDPIRIYKIKADSQLEEE